MLIDGFELVLLCRKILTVTPVFESALKLLSDSNAPMSQLFALGGQSPHFLHLVGSLHRQQGSSSCLIKLISLMYFLPEAHHTLLVLRTLGSTSGLHVGATLYSKTAKKSSKMQKKKNETLNRPQKGCLLRVWRLKPENITSLWTPQLDTCMDFVTMSALTWKQPRCLSKTVKKMWSLYTMEYYSVIKRMKFFICSDMDGLGGH